MTRPHMNDVSFEGSGFGGTDIDDGTQIEWFYSTAAITHRDCVVIDNSATTEKGLSIKPIAASR